MTFKKQFQTIKENWLLLVIAVILVFLFTGVGSIGNLSSTAFSSKQYVGETMDHAIAYNSAARYFPGSESYMPEVEQRIKIKTASLSIETKTNQFDTAHNQLNSFVSLYDADITSENVITNGKGIGAYKTGSFTIKIDTTSYDSLVTQLHSLGEVTSFNENVQDVTENYINTQDSLELETEKLNRYQALYDDAKTVEEKLQLEDRLANQERTIRYLEKQLENTEKRVEYTTISVSLREEQSSFANIALLKFGDWVRNLVTSVNTLLFLIAWVLPFGIAIWIFLFVKKRIYK